MIGFASTKVHLEKATEGVASETEQSFSQAVIIVQQSVRTVTPDTEDALTEFDRRFALLVVLYCV